MKRDVEVAPVVIFCIIGVFLLGVVGYVIELSVGRESLLWSITASLCPLLLAIISIHYLKNIKKYFAKRIFFRGIDYVVIGNYIVWVLILLMSVVMFIIFVMDALQ